MRISYFLVFAVIGLVVVPITGQCSDTGQVVILTAAQEHVVDVRLARTPEAWEQGLRGVDALKTNEGMLLLFPRESIITVTTSGASFPVDILLINRAGYIAAIIEQATGNRHHAAPFPILAALEVNGGFCRTAGIKAGDPVIARGFQLRPQDAPRPRAEDRQKVAQRLKANLEQFPDDPAVYEELAVFYTMSGEGEQAVQVFQDLVQMDATAPRLNGLGVAMNQTGRQAEAESYFRQAIAKDPLFYSSYNNLVLLYQRQGKTDQAIALLQDALAQHPDFMQARVGLGRLYLIAGDLPAVETVLASTSEQADKLPELIHLIGDLRLRQGNYPQAAEAYLQYLQARPYDPSAADLRVFILRHKAGVEQEKP